uniref:SRCR domain-containing protein n=1 Tax=Buteo japonicus TaxID=224669 RepID=A0A8C0AP50_9AVES
SVLLVHTARPTVLGLGALLTHSMLVFKGAAEVRLVNGSRRCAGRVEVKHMGQWGTMCSVFWDMNDAAVVCKQLGCGSAVGAPQYGYFGRGSGPVWVDSVVCKGTESALSDCKHSGWGKQNCGHIGDAGVMCSGFRLVNGSTACAGRVEIQVLEAWGTLCASHWDLLNAHVLCHQLNCGFAESIPGREHFGRETGLVWRDAFHCDGTETHLGQCPVITLGVSPCSAGFASLRLVGGGSRCDGRVEIFQNGTWGRVLDDQWDVQEASVVCRQLRCGEAGTTYNPAKPERGTGPVGAPVAGVVEDVGQLGFLPTTGSQKVRLVNGAGRCAGRVEIYYQGIWGTVCDDGWDLSDAAVVCHQLGCEGAVKVVGSNQFGEGSGQIWLDGVNCSGAEASLWDCPARPWGQHDCGHKEDAGVICSEFVALRLENSDGCSGRLQVFYNGTWGTICSNSMTLDTVSLVCKELGCGNGGSLETRLPSGNVSGPTWLDNVQCGEKTSSFWQCPSAPWNPQSCEDLREETHITCNGNSEAPGCTGREEKIRAVGGEDRCSGRVEVWHRGSWGTVCDDSWDMRDAEVACRQLGCVPAVSALHEAAFGMGKGPIWLEQVECRGTELSLQDCWARPGDGGACRHKEDAAVNCSGEWQGWDPLLGYWQGAGEALSRPLFLALQEGQFGWDVRDIHTHGVLGRRIPGTRTPTLSAQLSFSSSAATPRTAASPPQAGNLCSPQGWVSLGPDRDPQLGGRGSLLGCETPRRRHWSGGEGGREGCNLLIRVEASPSLIPGALHPLLPCVMGVRNGAFSTSPRPGAGLSIFLPTQIPPRAI